MADNKASNVPSTKPVARAPAAPAAGSQLPDISLPAETIRRWQEIVRQALTSGRDISVLVQQYAEQSFNSKLSSLDTQGARKRMLGRAHAALERERSRAQTHLEAQPSVAPPIMTRSFQANTLEVPNRQEAPPASAFGRSDKKDDVEWHHITTPVTDPFTKRAHLEAHVQRLTAQMQAIDKEIPSIDVVLNKGLRNQQSVVSELAAVSRELYRLAQEVQVDLPAKKPPADGSGYQKSVRKKETDISPATGPSTASSQSQDPPVTSTPVHVPPSDPNKTVPINPLVPAARYLAGGLSLSIGALGRLASVTLAPLGSALGQGIGATGAVLSSLIAAVTRAFGASMQALKDIWPWRGPPPQ